MAENKLENDEKSFNIILQSISKLKYEVTCKICKKYLSKPPVFLLKHQGNICVTCSNALRSRSNFQGNILRQTMYEQIASQLSFPCSNNVAGCNQQLRWGLQLKKHESKCNFSKISCPYRLLLVERKCKWKGCSKELNNHIRTRHNQLKKYPPEISLTNLSNESVFFTEINSKLVTIILLRKPNEIRICLLLHGSDLSSQCYKYQLEIRDEDEAGRSMIIRKNHCLNHLSNLKSLKAKFNSEGCNKQKWLCINMKTFDNCIGTPILRFGIVIKPRGIILDIAKKNASIIPLLELNECKLQNKSKVDKSIFQAIKILECVQCGEYLKPPIYLLRNGSSICRNCSLVLPTSLSVYSRNFLLEDWMPLIQYPCHNCQNGCNFVSGIDNILQHESVCGLNLINCVLKCRWLGTRRSLVQHLHEKHTKLMLALHTKNTFDIIHSNSMYFLVIHDNYLFRFGFKTKGNCMDVSVNVQSMWIGYNEDSHTERKFYYEIQFIGCQEGLDLNPLRIVQNCEPNITHTAKMFTNCFTIEPALYEPHIYNNEYVRFRFDIGRRTD